MEMNNNEETKFDGVLLSTDKLSIGNLVLYNNNLFYISDISSAWPRVEERYNNKPLVTIFDGGLITVGIDEISPIPITEEFISKNGFVLDDDINDITEEKYYLLKLDKFTITIHEGSNTLGRDWWVHIDNEDCCSIASADVQYVHQLQNLFNIANVKIDIRL
jgi:hypothetical protein